MEEQEKLWVRWDFVKAAADRGHLLPLITLLQELPKADHGLDIKAIISLLKSSANPRGRPRLDQTDVRSAKRALVKRLNEFHEPHEVPDWSYIAQLISKP